MVRCKQLEKHKRFINFTNLEKLVPCWIRCYLLLPLDVKMFQIYKLLLYWIELNSSQIFPVIFRQERKCTDAVRLPVIWAISLVLAGVNWKSNVCVLMISCIPGNFLSLKKFQYWLFQPFVWTILNRSLSQQTLHY